MKRESRVQLRPQNKERNQKIASILTLIMTVSAKIEKIKSKLCGFSSNDFSPQVVFEALDLTNKGHLDLYDIKELLNNECIRDQDILKFFIRLGSTTEDPKMSYLSYLNFLKPQFDIDLGRDLLMRDTVKKSKGKTSKQQQQAVILLVRELFLLNCICVAQHEDIKGALMDEYMLNSLELKQILGLDSSSPVKAIYQFVDCNSQYSVQLQEIKYLLAYLRIPQYQLSEQSAISSIFIPIRLDMQQIYTKHQKVAATDFTDRQRQKMHLNYDKNYLTKNDLSQTTQKLSFLNFIHPNSYDHPPPVRDTQVPVKKTVDYRNQSEDMIASEHMGLIVNQDRNRNKPSFQKSQRKDVREEQGLEPSQYVSGVYKSQRPQKLINSSDVPIHTPVLEQFMHQSNIRHNMGENITQRTVDQVNRPNQLNVLLEESSFTHMSNSQAFERVPRGQSGHRNTNNQPEVIKNKRNFPLQDRGLLNSHWRPKGMEVISSKMDVSNGSGLLNQFMRV